MEAINFTDEQRAIIAHGPGPAAVLAGAGTGKTTVLAHRVRRLVQEAGVPSGDILVSSFGRATVDDLQSALARLGVPGVTTCTLHALGLQILRMGRDDPASPLLQNDAPSPTTQAHALARAARSDLAAEREIDTGDLGYNASELADRIAVWKQSLTYRPDAFDSLPSPVQQQARKCSPDDDDLRLLFRRFEHHRRTRGWLTYADMVRTAWEQLATDPSLRDAAQSRYRYVLVDEFQDLSRAQVHLLDLLTAPHRNYMAMGDEDQCIYGWRGADPSYLLHFRDRYDAAEYHMTASFRSPASALVLANNVIAQNDERRATRLRCTRGFAGRTERLTPADASAEADAIADRLDALHTPDTPLHDIAVLVRTYGQTPALERAFLERDLPYRLTGAAPFYQRPAVRTLLQYLYWALLERRRRQNGWFSTDREVSHYTDRFVRILKRPTRYVPHERIRRVARAAHRTRTSALDRLRAHRSALPERTVEHVDAFLETAEALVDRLDAPPHTTLDWLVDQLDYTTHLHEISALRHRAEDRTRAVQGLIEYARHHTSPPALLSDIRSRAATQDALDADTPAIDLRSIHRAKGREWPIVVVPGCVDGTLPLSSTRTAASPHEEERRLLYVALTRARQHLLLSTPTHAPRSPFLTEASSDTTLRTVRAVRQRLTADPDTLSDCDLITLCQGITKLKLTSYLQSWWAPSPRRRAALRARIESLGPARATAQRRWQAHRQARAEEAARRQEQIARIRESLRSAQNEIGRVSLPATCDASASLPDNAQITFQWNEAESSLLLLWRDDPIGSLAPLGRHRLDAQTLLTLPWSFLVGRIENAAPHRRQLTFQIDWRTSIEQVDARVDVSRTHPPPPSDRTRALCDPAFRTGYEALRTTLSPP
jgi:DNA helicase-2/ATP-dependent DNA helicase PcrA